MHSIRSIALGIVFALGGLALFAYTLRKVQTPVNPKKSELRELQARQTETNKLRVAAAILVAVGAVLMIFS
jgi:uncharacterized protein YjeT (DUF2065 family)